jgi:hypothetical protein
MSAGKLSRYTGLVFVLAAIFGGVGAADLGAEHGTGGSRNVVNSGFESAVALSGTSDAFAIRSIDYDWQ